jgi:hypothetical protein
MGHQRSESGFKGEASGGPDVSRRKTRTVTRCGRPPGCEAFHISPDLVRAPDYSSSPLFRLRATSQLVEMALRCQTFQPRLWRSHAEAPVSPSFEEVRSEAPPLGPSPVRASAALLVAVLAVACGNKSPAPTAASIPRVTDRITSRIVVLPDGGTTYPDGPPIVRVQTSGAVDATASFSSPIPCLFILCACQDSCRTCALQSPQGPGPALAAAGTLSAGDYQFLLGARSGGVSLCPTVPPGGLRFSYDLTVVHP